MRSFTDRDKYNFLPTREMMLHEGTYTIDISLERRRRKLGAKIFLCGEFGARRHLGELDTTVDLARLGAISDPNGDCRRSVT
jgi:hypothetical protein